MDGFPGIKHPAWGVFTDGVSPSEERTFQEKAFKKANCAPASSLTAIQLDKSDYRIKRDWQKFIIKTFKEGNSGGRKMAPTQVTIRVQAKAELEGLDKFPSYMTVYRVLKPIIERKQQKQMCLTL